LDENTAADDPTPSVVFYDANRKGGRPAAAVEYKTLQKMGNDLVFGTYDEVRDAVAALLPFDPKAHADKINTYVEGFLHLTEPWCTFSREDVITSHLLMGAAGPVTESTGMKKFELMTDPADKVLVYSPELGVFQSSKKFKLFKRVCVVAMAPEREWERGKDDKTWEMFAPVVNGFNGRRQALLGPPLVLVFDESMSRWVPKNSVTGGLPNISQIVRKPVPIGTELKDTADGQTKIMRALECQRGAVAQRMRPHSVTHGATAGCTLRLAKQSGANATTVSVADAWFGSVWTVTSLVKAGLGHSVMIVKTASSGQAYHFILIFR
jgi:hypothetical protein